MPWLSIWSRVLFAESRRAIGIGLDADKQNGMASSVSAICMGAPTIAFRPVDVSNTSAYICIMRA